MKRAHNGTAIVWTLAFVFVNSISFSQDVIVQGIVKHGDELLSAATVSIGNRTVLTDDNGKFSFPVRPGSYLIIVTHVAYNKIIQEIKVEPGKPQDLEFEMIPIDQLDEVVLLGSRTLRQRSNLKTPIPVDAFSSNMLQRTGQVSLTQMLNFVAPSFNTSRELLNESATLRGFDPDHLLILLNGTRYHNPAFLFLGNLKGQLGRGSVANDVNSIPFSAVEKVEVLREGASSQYGSDAIAGVINIILKEAPATSFYLHTGKYYEGDGDKFSFGIYQGIPLNKKGFINFSADFRFQDLTHRGGTYTGTVYATDTALDNSIIAARKFNRKLVPDNVGNSEFKVGGILINGEYNIHNQTKIFWTAAFNDRKVYRELSYIFPKQNNRVIPDLYPDGFQPISKPNTIDISTIAGIRGETKKNWRWELNSSFGNNKLKTSISNTNNASQFAFGKSAQTSFYTGSLLYDQLTNTFNIVKKFKKLSPAVSLLNLGMGAEWRWEKYETTPGEKASWYDYDPMYHRKQAGVAGAISDSDIINNQRNETGIYIDLETEFKNKFLVDIATRYEYYSDFGGNLAGKIALRYKLSESFSLRGSIGNGFRAPSLQQRYHKSISFGYLNIGGILTPSISGLFPNNDKVTQAFGIPSLTAEHSLNINNGFTAKLLDHISLTVDAYWVQIKNRIVLSGTFDTTDTGVRNILANIPGTKVTQLQFFTNAINTRTKGLDIVLNGQWNIQRAVLSMMLGANFNTTKLFGNIKTTDKLHNDSLLFNIEEKARIEKGQPKSKIILNLDYKIKKFAFNVRNTSFGKTSTITIVKLPTDTLYESFNPKILTDISISYSPKKWLTITAGANNVLDVYPDPLRNSRNTGEGRWIYSPEASPFGFNGGYYFINLAFNFFVKDPI